MNDTISSHQLEKDTHFPVSNLWHMLLSIIIAFYILFGVIYLIARFTVGESLFVVTIGNIILHWYLAAALVLLPIYLLTRLWSHSAVLSVFVVVFLWQYGGLFLPSAPKQTEGTTLRVMTFNAGVRLTSAQEFTDIINRDKPDIVSIIEASEDNIAHAQTILKPEFPYTIIGSGADDHKLLLSKYPIVREDIFAIKTQRVNIEAYIDVEGTEIAVYLVHPPSPDWHDSWNFYAEDPNNPLEVTEILQRAPQNQPVLLLGDFNLTQQSPSYRKIMEYGYTDAFRRGGFGFGSTYNARFMFHAELPEWLNLPITRIDYIWHSSHFTTISAKTGIDTGSDHLPVIAELVLR